MKKILSIDGGGIRGLIPALVLTEIEDRTGKRIADCFDLIVGTSTGGILSLGLGKKNSEGSVQYKARELADIYIDEGKEIFSRSLWKGVASVGGLTDEKYSHDGLERILKNKFGEHTLISDLCTNVMVTSYEIQQRRPVFIKSWKDEFKNLTMWKAGRATSAAPTYFEPTQTNISGSIYSLIDGGVFINNPSVSAYVSAKKTLEPDDEYILVSLGTGELIRSIPHKEAKDWGQLEWLIPLLSCMFDGMSDAADYQMKELLGNNYYRLQTDLSIASDDMDNATSENINHLKEEAEKLIRVNDSVIRDICGLL